MKKALVFLLALAMLFSATFIIVSAEEPTQTNVEQGNTDCTCGGSYGNWQYPVGADCVGGRYYRECDSCDNVQTAKDITSETVSFSVPAIGANTGDVVMLSLYDVYFTSNNVVSAANIVWSSEDIEIVDNCVYPTVAGTYKLTATSGTSTKSVYLIAKNPTDTEYVLFYDDFNRETLGSDYRAIEVPTGTEYYISEGKLVMDATGNDNNQMRILLPSWVGDFGNYKIDTRFTILSTHNNNNTYWFATMARVQNEDYPFWQAAIRQNAAASSGVEIAKRTKASGQSNGWSVPSKGKYTEAISSSTYYTQTFDINGKTAVHSINGKAILTYSSVDYSKGDVGFHTRASVVSIDSIKIAVPINDSIHNYGDWVITKAATCTVNGVETRTCANCGTKEERAIVAEHKSFGDWYVDQPATCTVNGVEKRVCADCSTVEERSIKASHNIVKQAEKAPTCTESGWREYNICTNCDYTTFAGEVGPFGHYFDREIKCIAHRGYSVTAPENTLPAYILARELGFLYAECDVAFTKDGVAVLLHDTTIDRTSNGSGKISELTYEELLQYDFGSWKNSSYAGTKIPTFEEFIILCKEIGIHPYIEIKNDDTYTQEQVASLVEITRKHGMEDNCTWISFSLDYLAYVKNADDTARLGYVSSKTITQSMINSVLALRTGNNEVFLDISYNMINEGNAMLAALNGIALETWTVDNTNDIKARSKYISGYTSNKLVATDTLVKVAVTAPTCGEQGYTTYTCLCGVSKVDDYVPATGEHVNENGVCANCSSPIYCANSEHNLEIISIAYQNGFDKAGVKTVRCLDCNATETETEALALFVCKGFSVPEGGKVGVALGFDVNRTAVSEYEAVTGESVRYGAFVVAQSKIQANEIFDANGNAASGVICADVTDYQFGKFDVMVVGFAEDQKELLFAMGAYVATTKESVTKYSYIQNAVPNENELYSFVSYNKVVNPKNKEEEAE